MYNTAFVDIPFSQLVDDYVSTPSTSGVDVLVLTALQDELDALLMLGPKGRAGWSELYDNEGFRYFLTTAINTYGDELTLAAAWSGEMGERAAAIRAQQLLTELDPACLAMCGICAGHRGKVGLGDIIVAEKLYSYDEGKFIAAPGKEEEILHEVCTFDLHPTWKMEASFLAREFDLSTLLLSRPPSTTAQRRWLLHTLYAHETEGGPAPHTHPERVHMCPKWSKTLQDAVKGNLVTRIGSSLILTDLGTDRVEEERLLHPDQLPQDPPLRIHIGAIATGKMVQEDRRLFNRLQHVVRTTIGVEMEGVAIGDVAARFRKQAVVIKAVADHADEEKDDSFRIFACRASAEVLLAFLLKHLKVNRESLIGIDGAKGRSARILSLSKQLLEARSRKRRLDKLGATTQEVDNEILNLRRALRAGGQLNTGDALGKGRYVLLEPIGRGGFANVWKAYDETKEKLVALKVLHPDLSRDETRCERFSRGARAMAELRHSAVVPVIEYDCEDDGWRFFVMELAAGGDLRQAVIEKRLSVEEVLDIVEQVGDALAAAHKKGLIHRDVKPANIVLNESGAAWLTDFDLVVAADSTGGTRTGALGTFLYAAPELLQRPQDADARADVYGLGMTTVFALYGRELSYEIFKKPELLIDSLPCTIKIKATLKRAISWNRKIRFASITAFCTALKQGRNSAVLTGVKRTVAERLEAAQALPLVAKRIETMWMAASACNAVAWSPSGEILASGHDDGSLRLWNTITGRAIRAIKRYSGPIRSIAFSPDGYTIASGSDDTTVRLWDVASGKALRPCDGHQQRVTSVTFSPDGLFLASGSDDTTVRLWDVPTGREIRAFTGHRSTVRSIAFSRDGMVLASGSDDTTVRLWDSSEGTFLYAFTGHTNTVRSVSFGLDVLASGSDDTTVRLWEVATRRELLICKGHEYPVPIVAFSPEGRTLASGSNDTTVRLWDVTTARELRIFADHVDRVTSLAFSPDGRTLASGSVDRTVRLWNVTDGRSLRTFAGHQDRITSVAFSPNGLTVVTGSYGRTIRLWDAITGCSLSFRCEHKNPIWSVAFNPKNRTLASCSDDAVVRVWNVARGGALRPGRKLKGHTDWVWTVAFSPDGRILASGSNDKTICLWDAARGVLLRKFEEHTTPVWSVAFSPDGKELVSSGSDSILVWHLRAGSCRTAVELLGHQMLCIAYSPDGKTVAWGSGDGVVYIWNRWLDKNWDAISDDSQEIRASQIVRCRMRHVGRVRSIAYSPDSRTIATGSDDNTVRLWNVDTGQSLCTLKEHSDWVRSVAFSPDGKTLATGSADGTVRFWKLDSYRCYAILLASPEGWVTFTPNGYYKFGGDTSNLFWHVIDQFRFDSGELDTYLTEIRLSDDSPLVDAKVTKEEG